MLEQFGAGCDDSRTAALRVLSYLDFSHFHLELPLAPLRDRSISDRADAFSRLASPVGDRLPTREWAELAVQALGATGGVRPPKRDEMGTCYELSTLLGDVGGEQRHMGQPEQARRTADRMMALGHVLLARYPKHPYAHLALSDAYHQKAKNAWHPMDRVAIDQNLQLALDAALQALALNPRYELPMYKVNELQRRLRDFRNPR